MGQVILPVSKHSENAQGNKTFFADLVHWQGILELERVSAISLTYDRLAVLMLCIITCIDPPNETFSVHYSKPTSVLPARQAHRATQYGHHWTTGFQGSQAYEERINRRSIHQPPRRALPRHPHPPPFPRSLPTTIAEQVHPQLHRQLRRSSLD